MTDDSSRDGARAHDDGDQESAPSGACAGESSLPTRDPVTVAAVLGGLLVGVVGSVIYGVLAFSIVGGSGVTGVLVAVGAPALVALALLAVGRTRRAGSGFVMGLALGTILVAGACLGPAL